MTARVAPTLLDLSDLGFEILRKGHDDPRFATRLHDLAGAIAKLGSDQRLQARFLTGAEILIQTLQQLAYFRRVDPDQAPAWEALVGSALAITRAQAWKSLHWEKEHLT